MITIEKKLITPTLAKELLEQNISNRTPKKPVIARYADDIINDRWKEDTGELIKVSKSGLILDGQHRLMAVVKANKSVYFHVAYNVEDSVFDVIDTGSKRSGIDVFKTKGIQNETVIPSIITFYEMLKDNRKRPGTAGKQGLRKTNSELLDIYYSEPQFWANIAKETMRLYKCFSMVLLPSYIGGFYAHLSKLNNELASEFMEQLCTGVGIKCNAIYMLRNRLIEDKISIKKLQQPTKIALTIKAWNLFIKGDDTKKLSYNPIIEDFPKANG